MLKFLQSNANIKSKSKITETGEFTIAACIYDVIGNQFYKFKEGAFDTYIKSGRMPAMLWGHNSYELPIGVYTKLYSENGTLYADGKLNLNLAKPKEIASHIEFYGENGGKPMGASVGLSSSQRKIKTIVDKEKEIYTIVDTDLSEISLCSCEAIIGSSVVSFAESASLLGFDSKEIISQSDKLKKFIHDNKKDMNMTIRSLENFAQDVLGLSRAEAKDLAFNLKQEDASLFYEPLDVVKKEPNIIDILSTIKHKV